MPLDSAPSASPSQLSERLAALAGLDLNALRAEWRRLHRSSPPMRLSRDLLQRSIAHRLQEEAFGGLSPAAERQLAAIARTMTADGSRSAAAPALKLKAGTTLVREWHDHTHTVVVLENGFEHAGMRYASLTQIARAITGAHWSGPRFFGLHRRGKGGTGVGATEGG